MGKKSLKNWSWNNLAIDWLLLIVWIFLKNSGNISGSEPTSMVCKISGNDIKKKTNFIERALIFALVGKSGIDDMNRHEIEFYKNVAPHLIDTPFKSPKVFFAGITA